MNRLLDDLNRYLDVIDKWRGQSRKKNVEEALSLATEYEKVVNDVFKRGKGEPEKYYDLMRRLAYPVYCKLGGNGCIMD